MRILSEAGKVRSWLNRVGSRASSPSGSWSSTGLRSSTGGRRFAAPLLQSLADPGNEPSHLQQVGHELRERLRPVLVALREVANDALLEVDLELVALLHRLGRLRRLEDRVAHVDRVAEEDPRKGVGDHERDARAADGDRRDLAGRATTEVRAADEYGARL